MGTRVVMEVSWGEVEKFVPAESARKGVSTYPFDEMEAGGKVLQVRGRALGSVRDAIKRYARMRKLKDSRFKRRYVARLARDDRGEFVKVWRLQ